MMSGLVFGSYLYFLQRIDTQSYVVFTVFIIGSISSGSVSIHSTSMTAFTIYNMFSIVPYSIYFLFWGSGNYVYVGVLIIILLVSLYITAYQVNKMLSTSLELSLENKLIIDKLSQSEEKFSKSFYSGIAPMVMLRYDTVEFLDGNNAFFSLLEYSRNEIIGKTAYYFNKLQNNDDVLNLILESSKTGSVSGKEISLITSRGKIIHCLATVESFKVNTSVIALVMLQDFTDRIGYEKQLEFERDRAEEAANAKSRFLAAVSHEIRTPMNSILGMTNLALLSDSNREKNEYLGVVKDAGNYLLSLINDILDLSKIEAGKIQIDLINTDIHKLVEDVFRTMELLVLSKKLSFTKNISPDVPRYIKIAPDRLRQILINLIGNAIKFTNEGGITISVYLSEKRGAGQNSDAGSIGFSVSDTGIGVPEDKYDIIFDSFTQADDGIFRKYGGTGLGLTISRQIIKAMNGDITVESKVGEGTTFRFFIPLYYGEKPSELGLEINDKRDPDVLRTILIAEDNIMNQKLIKAYMKKLGHNYTIVENGYDVLSKLKSEHYDMVFMDLELPDMNGYDAMKQIRSGAAGDRNTNIIIYAMSAHVLKNTINKCIDEGFSGYITKPLDLKRLKEII